MVLFDVAGWWSSLVEGDVVLFGTGRGEGGGGSLCVSLTGVRVKRVSGVKGIIPLSLGALKGCHQIARSSPDPGDLNARCRADPSSTSGGSGQRDFRHFTEGRGGSREPRGGRHLARRGSP